MEQANNYRRLLRGLFPDSDKKNVFVVNGSPGSGKTHFVKSRIKPDDIALDLDWISAALALDDQLYGNRKPQLDVALAIRDTILQKVENREGKWGNAYIITSEKNAQKVQQLSERLGAELITMNATKDQCIENIRNDQRREGVAEAHIQLAERWYQEE